MGRCRTIQTFRAGPVPTCGLNPGLYQHSEDIPPELSLLRRSPAKKDKILSLVDLTDDIYIVSQPYKREDRQNNTLVLLHYSLFISYRSSKLYGSNVKSNKSSFNVTLS